MLAQLVEQRTFNPFVVGSTPAHPTNKFNGLAETLGHFRFQCGVLVHRAFKCSSLGKAYRRPAHTTCLQAIF